MTDHPQYEKIGAALVVGGGVGAIQAALDLAESGIKVYVVETKASIGGVMAQLDKTFPTNDCAMCTIAPRLVGVDRHKDIEILTLSDVETVEGAAGHFSVVVNRRARYVDESKCTGCGICFAGCPVVLKNDFDVGLSDRKAIYTLFPQAVPNKAAIEMHERRACNAACVQGCPVHTNVLGYVKHIAEGRFRDAYLLNREVNPFPSICGRVCYAPCEKACNRGQLDEPLSIRNLKRFVADQVDIDSLPVPHITRTGKKVAIIGAGPAGLAAANDLALSGHDVVVYEAQKEPGGMLRYGIPEYRLPRDILRKEIAYIERLGVKLNLGTKIEGAFPRSDFDAVFVGVGAQEGLPLDAEGSDLQGVMDGLVFLHAVNTGERIPAVPKVAIIGGGNTAIDCARTVKRLGAADVRIVYRRTRKEMPASEDEIAAAEHEGIALEYLTLPKRFSGEKGILTGMECIRMSLGEPDASGRRRPIPIPGSEFTVPVDMVITGLGQRTQKDLLRDLGIAMSTSGTAVIDPGTGSTNVPGVFAGGDVVSGASYVIDAIAAGKRAARSINSYLAGEPLRPEEPDTKPEPLSDAKVAELRREFAARNRVAMPELSPAERRQNFREVALGFTREQAMAEASRCLASSLEGCIECGECERRCGPKAIDYSQEDARRTLEVGAIILAPGYEPFDASGNPRLGYGTYANVVNALQFERILSPSGPFEGHILRPSDKKPPKSIAFLQCVGSRDAERNYCSSVCCMFATKEAIIAKEHAGENLRCDIFFMDIRAYSKGFEAYFESAKKLGVHYVRCRVPVIQELPGSRSLRISYLGEHETKESRDYDLVVLSIGMQPPRDAAGLANTFGIELNEFGFCKASSFTPVESSRPGVFVAGPFTEPKDIPESVVQCSGAAAKALALLQDVRGTLIRPKIYPKEIDVRGQEPRVGVFICHCGTNIGGVVDVPGVVEYARTLPGVVYAERNLYTCSNDTQERIKAIIVEHRLNRVVVASCTPRTHEPLFRNTLQEAGLNQFLFEMANIRDQCSWVHQHEPEKATVKARDLMRIAVAKVKLNEPLYAHPLEVCHEALVIGGGVSGLTAALAVADQGYPVHLVEREPALGGYLRRARSMLDGEDPKAKLSDLVERAHSHPNIRVYTNAKLIDVQGSLGNFHSRIDITGNGGPVEVRHGVIIVATGAETYTPTEYLYRQDDRVLLAEEWEDRLSSDKIQAHAVAFIQCVGSRNAERPYCSRTCCSETVKHAIEFKKRSPDNDVVVFYREMRTYGFHEAFYTEARRQGVAFVRFRDDSPPVVAGHNGRLSVVVREATLDEQVEYLVDNVILAAATAPCSSNKELAQMLKVPLGEDKFFLEAHRKLRPIDFATDGIFLCGNAHSPLATDEAIAQALGTAARAATVLSKEKIDLEPTVSHVVEENCDGCALCVDTCPFKAISLMEYEADGKSRKRVQVNESLCKGCGTCMATCPKKAMFVWHFRPEMLAAEVRAALETL